MCCWLMFAIHWELEPQGQPLLSFKGARALFYLHLFLFNSSSLDVLPIFILDTLSAFHSLPSALSYLVCQLVSRT